MLYKVMRRDHKEPAVSNIGKCREYTQEKFALGITAMSPSVLCPMV